MPKLPPRAKLPPVKSESKGGKKGSRISLSLKDLVVPIDSVKLDPDNARLHPERNIRAIQKSLERYGQTKPIVANRKDKIILAGNGTWEAAKGLGWVEIAVSFVDMAADEAKGYSIADNRTAELAVWDYERVGKLFEDGEQDTIGWSDDELLVLRGFNNPPDGDSKQVRLDRFDEKKVTCPDCGKEILL